MMKHQLIEDRNSAKLTDFHINSIKNKLEEMSAGLEKYEKAELNELVNKQKEKIHGFKLALTCVGIDVTEVN